MRLKPLPLLLLSATWSFVPRLTRRRATPQSFFEADGAPRKAPEGLSESALRAIEATEVKEERQLVVAELRCQRSTVHGWGLFAGALEHVLVERR